MAKTREKRGESFYRELRAELARSGRSQREFAAERGIPAGTLSGWFHKLRKLDAARARAKRVKVPPSPADPGAAQSPPFVAVRVTDVGTAGYEVIFGKSVLRLPADFDPVRVGALLRSLEAAC